MEKDRSAEAFRALYASNIIGILIGDAERIVEANDAFLSLVRYDRDDLAAGRLRWRDMTPPEYAAQDDRRLQELLAAGACRPFEKEYYCQDGSRVPILIAAALLERSPLRWIGYVLDLSERRQGEAEQVGLLQREQEALARAVAAEDALAAVLERVPVGIILVDAAGRLLLMNEVGRQISGEQPDASSAVEDQTELYALREPVTGRPLAPQETPIAQAVAGQVVNGYEYTFRRPTDESEVWIRTDAVPLRSADGTITGAVAVFYDVTQQRTLERQRDDFLSAAAHDLKSPLASIKGFAQLLRRNLKRDNAVDRDKILEGLDRIEMTTTRMTSLIGELLDATTLQLDQPLDLHRRPIDLVALAERVASDQQQTTDHHRLLVESRQQELIGEWDADRLARVLANLLSNAIKYAPNGGDIVVRIGCETEAGEDWAVLEVEDGGLGIPTADLPHIFERFRRGQNVTGEIAGTGIGLSGSKQIIEQQGGTIGVTSHEGEGSTFTIRLPVGSPRTSPS